MLQTYHSELCFCIYFLPAPRFSRMCWHHIYGDERHDDRYVLFGQNAEYFHLRINTIGYFLPTRLPGLIMGNSVAFHCYFFFQFFIWWHDNDLFVLREIHSSRPIHFDCDKRPFYVNAHWAQGWKPGLTNLLVSDRLYPKCVLYAFINKGSLCL